MWDQIFCDHEMLSLIFNKFYKFGIKHKELELAV